MNDASSISVVNEELIAPRDFQRRWSKYLSDLEEGEIEKLVITRHGKFRAVVLTVEDYAELRERAGE